MKVLFAVSNEAMSNSIVKKYQNEYKQIISSKNVFYFSAIIKELQRDKTYDYVVIAEDLEDNTKINDSQKDAYLLEKLDKISDEACLNGRDIPIIIICSDRRAKSDEVLNRMFGMGIYNALIGPDRNIANVVQLLKSPRIKKSAKEYYKIENEAIGYISENENQVSEEEIQNIRAHYLQAPNDEKTYLEIFQRIVEQYNDQQLKTICKFLPENVQKVLQEKSEKYKKIMAFSINQDIRIKNNDKQGTLSILLSTNASQANKMSSPVIIPNTVDRIGIRKVETKKQEELTPEQILDSEYEMQKKYSDEKLNNENENQINNNNDDGGANMINPFAKNKEKNESENNQNQNVVQNPFAQQSPNPFAQPNQNVMQDNTNPFSNQPQDNPFANPNPAPTQNPMQDNSNPFANSPQDNPFATPPQDNPFANPNPAPTQNPMQDNSNPFATPPQDNPFANPNPAPTQNPMQDNSNPFANPPQDNTFATPQDNPFANPAPTQNPIQDNSNPFANPPQDNPFANPMPNPFAQEMQQINPIATQVTQQINDMNQTNQNQMPDSFAMQEPMESVANQFMNTVNRTSSVPSGVYEKTRDLTSELPPDKKVVAFVGTSKNGTSFLVNHLAQLMSSAGIKTAILDTTRNKNSYYVYTNTDEKLISIATTCLANLAQGKLNGVEINKNLTVFTSLPDDTESLNNVDTVLETLINNYQLVLIDTDYDTNPGYFAQAQDLFLVQSMDILTIQPLTAFLKDLKEKGFLDERKIKIILNKYVKLKNVSDKMLIGGMSTYNNPSMSYMVDLFNKEEVKFIKVPFELDIYVKYLECIAQCDVTFRGYSKQFITILKELGNLVYPMSTVKTGLTGMFNSSEDVTVSQNDVLFNRSQENPFSNGPVPQQMPQQQMPQQQMPQQMPQQQMPQMPQNPFGEQPMQNPFGEQPVQNPFGNPPMGQNPFGDPMQNPFGNPAPQNPNPFGNPMDNQNGQNPQNPFSNQFGIYGQFPQDGFNNAQNFGGFTQNYQNNQVYGYQQGNEQNPYNVGYQQNQNTNHGKKLFGFGKNKKF